MNSTILKQLIREALTEAKKAKEEKKKPTPKKAEKKSAPTEKKPSAPKSTGKLVDLKKERESLKRMQEALGKYMVNEGETETQLEAAFSHQQSYINEMAKIKQMTAALSEKMNSDLSLVEEKIKAETAKIKEMMGVNSGEEKIEEKKKPSAGMTKNEKSNVVKKARAGKDIGKSGKGFEKVAKAAGGGEKGQKVAAAAMWKQQAKK